MLLLLLLLMMMMMTIIDQTELMTIERQRPNVGPISSRMTLRISVSLVSISASFRLPHLFVQFVAN